MELRRVLLLAGLVVLLPACGDSDSNVVLPPSGPINGTGGGDEGPAFGPGNLPAFAFMAQKNLAGTDELFVASLDGQTLRNVSGGVATNATAGACQWSPSADRLLFELEKEIDGVKEVFTVPSTGGMPVRLHPPLAPGENARFSAWSPDGTLVAYLSNQDDPARIDLYVSPPATAVGNVRVSIHPVVDEFTSVGWSPLSNRLLYKSSDATASQDLHVAKADGSGVVTITEAAAAPGRTAGGHWSPDGTKLLYLTRESGAPAFDLCVIDADGTNRVTISTASGPAAWWSPDGQRLAFRSGSVVWTCSPTGSSMVDVSGTAASSIVGVAWSPDGSRLAYWLQNGGLYTAPPAVAGQSLLLSGSLVVSACGWSPDSLRLVYAGYDSGSGWDIFVSQATFAGALKVSGPLASGAPSSPVWAPNSALLYYHVIIPGVFTIHDLYAAAADGSGSAKVTPPAAAWGLTTTSPQWTSDSSRLLFMSDPEANLIPAVYSALPDGSATSKVSGSTLGEGVRSFRVRP